MTIRGPDDPMPLRVYCCGHSADCAVHQPPFDAAYVHCTCDEGAGRPRHKRFTPDPQLMPEHKTEQ